MVSRKTSYVIKEKKRRTKTGVKVKKSFDYASLPDVVVDGKLALGVGPGAQLIVVKPLDGKSQISLCEVRALEDEPKEKGGIFVTTWDMTLERFLNFSTSDLVKSRHRWTVKLKTPAEQKAVDAAAPPEDKSYVVTLGEKKKLPIVNDPDVQPSVEPKLLQIQEPSSDE